MGTFRDEVAIVTGASRGIGRAIACELAQEGAAVVVNYRQRRDEAEEVVAEIVGNGGRAIAVQADVGDEAEVKKLIAAAVRELGRIDVLICNAGIVRSQLAAALRLEDWEAVIRTNLQGAFLCIREALPRMIAAKRGSIVAVSSVAADCGGRGQVNYAASKGGLDAMVRSLAVELAPKGIRVNAVAPGVILTEMSQWICNRAPDEILARVPLRRFGDPREVARAVRFLASGDAAYITGEVLRVTGGLGL